MEVGCGVEEKYLLMAQMSFFVVLFNLKSEMWIYLLQQKLAKKDGARIDRNRDAERLWDFYQKYKRRHRVDDIQREEQRYRESGTFSANLGKYVLNNVFNIINLNVGGLNLLDSSFINIEYC